MRQRKPGSWLIPGGLTGGWKFTALWARTQIRADQKVWKSGQGYTPDNWNPGKLSRVKSILSKGDVQAAGTYSLQATSAGGVRRNPLPIIREKTTGNHRIVAAVAIMPRVEKVISGRCIPRSTRTVSVLPPTGQEWINNREVIA